MKTAIIKPATIPQAKKRMNELREKYEVMRGSWYDLGLLARKAIMAGDLQALVLSRDDWVSQWASDVGGRTTVLDLLRIAEELATIPEATVRAMDKGNALALTRLPKSKRTEEMIRKAKNMHTREFAELVRQVRDGKHADEPQQEIRTFKPRAMNKESCDQWKRARERFGKRAGCDIDSNIPDIYICAYLEMLTEEEIDAFFAGVSAKMVGAA